MTEKKDYPSLSVILLKKLENGMIYGGEHVCSRFSFWNYIIWETYTASEPLHMEYYKEQDKRHMHARILDTYVYKEGNTDRISEISKHSRVSRENIASSVWDRREIRYWCLRDIATEETFTRDPILARYTPIQIG